MSPMRVSEVLTKPWKQSLNFSEMDMRKLKTIVCHILLLFAFPLRDNELGEMQMSFREF